MKRIVLLLVSLFVVFLSTGCGPSDAEKHAQQVAGAKDHALQLRQQLAQAKSGADAENVRQQIMKVLSDASLTVESIYFTEAELENYVKAASAAEKPAPPPPKKAKAASHQSPAQGVNRSKRFVTSLCGKGRVRSGAPPAGLLVRRNVRRAAMGMGRGARQDIRPGQSAECGNRFPARIR